MLCPIHKLFDFDSINGSYPNGDLISDGTFLYGMTRNGGLYNFGTIFKIKTDGTGYSKLLDFNTTKGKYPNGSLIFDGTFLYGMTIEGGGVYSVSGGGVLFKIKPNGTSFTKLLAFDTTTSWRPMGSLISDGTFLYGMTTSGNTYTPGQKGELFKIKTDGTGHSILHHFVDATGTYPMGSLFSDGTFLYGMTRNGGSSGLGVVFKIIPDGTGYTVLINCLSGRFPYGSLISDGTFLYGMTSTNTPINNYGAGTIFKIKPDGTSYSDLLCFLNTTARDPYGSLISDGTFLYGMTQQGGTVNGGVLFKIKSDGTGYTDLLDFAGASNGKNPYGSLISDGIFLYGMTNGGGSYNKGVIFKYQYANCFAHYTTIYDSLQNTFNLNVDASTTGISNGYHWDFGDGTTSTFATPSHVYTLDSLYNVCLKVYTSTGDSCTYCHIIGKDTAGTIIRTNGFALNVHNALTTSISQNNYNETKIEVYPNPTNGISNLKMSDFENVKMEKLEIYNILGEKIYSRTNFQINKSSNYQIDLSSHSNGIYFINIKTAQGIVSKKLIINN